MELEERVKQALLGGPFADAEISLEATATGRVGGFLVSPDFAGMSQVDRQELLWKELETRLSRDELVGIVSILTLTPDEVKEAS